MDVYLHGQIAIVMYAEKLITPYKMFQNLEEDLVAYHLDLLQEKRVTLAPVPQHKERYDFNELITKTNCVCEVQKF